MPHKDAGIVFLLTERHCQSPLDLIVENRTKNGQGWNFLWFFLYVPVCKDISVHTTWSPLSQELSSGKYTFFDLCLFCYFASLEHCAQAIQLSGKVCKVLEQLPCTFFSDGTQSLLRRLRSEFKGALWPHCCLRNSSIGLEDLFIDVLMLYYACSCCKEPFSVTFFEMGSFVN